MYTVSLYCLYDQNLNNFVYLSKNIKFVQRKCFKFIFYLCNASFSRAGFRSCIVLGEISSLFADKQMICNFDMLLLLIYTY